MIKGRVADGTVAVIIDEDKNRVMFNQINDDNDIQNTDNKTKEQAEQLMIDTPHA